MIPKRYFVIAALGIVLCVVSVVLAFLPLNKRVQEGERRLAEVERIERELGERIRTIESVVERVVVRGGTTESRSFRDDSNRPRPEPGPRPKPRPKPRPSPDDPVPDPKPPRAPDAPPPPDAPTVDDPREDPCDDRKYRRKHRKECRNRDDDLLSAVSNVAQGAFS